MQIQESAQAFEVVDGRLQFVFTTVILLSEGSLYHGRSQKRKPMLVTEVEDIKELDTEAYGPVARAEWTAKDDISCSAAEIKDIRDYATFIKRPSWIQLARWLPGEAEASMTAEIQVCEKLRQDPHPNLGQYQGCIVSSRTGKVSALSFDRLPMSLAATVNPSGLSKADFAACGNRADPVTACRWIRGVRNGLSHLHALGLVHNDVNPSNVMIDGAEAILVDFDSCCEEGQELRQGGKKGGTPGWCDLDVQVARIENDWEAVDEMETWLMGEARHFRFHYG
jgi:serine/threonine protein kinase